MPLTCERWVGRGKNAHLCGEKAIGASFDVNGEYGIGYCAKHEPAFAARERLMREHPMLEAYAEMRWVGAFYRAMFAPFRDLWKMVRRGTR